MMNTNPVMLTFLLFMVSISSAMESRELAPIGLSMMVDSVDDMYKDCMETMAEKVIKTFFPQEMKNNQFKDAWKVAASFAKTIYEKRKDKALSIDQIQAIYVYTQEFPNVYEPFNAAVRNGAAIYGTKAFQYHALHFWLTSAIQILNKNKACRLTYRRTKVAFTGKVNNEMRFGSYTSASKSPDLITFGTVTCFHIRTCCGAYIKGYSKKSDEREVLIPPYEKFKIVEIAKGSYEDLKDCKTVFVLESAGLESNQDCKVAHKVKEIMSA